MAGSVARWGSWSVRAPATLGFDIRFSSDADVVQFQWLHADVNQLDWLFLRGHVGGLLAVNRGCRAGRSRAKKHILTIVETCQGGRDVLFAKLRRAG